MHKPYFFSTSILLLSLYFTLNCSLLLAQDKQTVDSLLNLLPAKDDTTSAMIYQELQQLYQFTDPAECKKYLDLQIDHANQSGDEAYKMQAIYSEAIYNANMGDLKTSEAQFEAVLVILDELDLPKKKAKALRSLALLQGNMGKYDQALEKTQESLKIMDMMNMSDEAKAPNYRNLGNIHGIIENWELSDKYYRIAKNINLELGNMDDAMIDSLSIGINLIQQKKFEAARPVVEGAVNYFEQSDDKMSLCFAYSNLGNIEQQTDNPNEAELNYLKGLAIAETTGMLSDYVVMSTRLADIYNDTGRNQKAVNSLKEVEAINGQYGDSEMQLVILGQLEDSYSNLNQCEDAYGYLKKYKSLEDSLQSVQKIQDINELEAKYQLEKKEQEIKLLEEKSKRSAIEKKGMIFGIIGLSGLFGLFVYAMRQRIKSNKLEKEKLDKELSFSKVELDLKKQELSAFALQLAHKNEVLEDIKSNVKRIHPSNNEGRELQKIINTININQNDDNSWEGFRKRFQAVHKTFESTIKNQFPKVTSNELRLMSLLKMQLSSKEIANILNISSEGIKKARYRLRKKLDLRPKDSLEELVLNI